MPSIHTRRSFDVTEIMDILSLASPVPLTAVAPLHRAVNGATSAARPARADRRKDMDITLEIEKRRFTTVRWGATS
jgi:hypothetical protein